METTQGIELFSLIKGHLIKLINSHQDDTTHKSLPWPLHCKDAQHRKQNKKV
jgi:hypothetical protein